MNTHILLFIIFHILRYFINLLYSFHCLSFPFPKGNRLEKGHIVPVLCSHSHKKNRKIKKGPHHTWRFLAALHTGVSSDANGQE